MTIAGGASVILLDEPTAGMSNTETDNAVELIRRISRGKTLVMVEHDMKVVFDLADVITVLVYGKVIASGPPQEVRANPRRAGSLSRGAGRRMILEVRDLHAYYGQSHILHGVAMDVNDGEIVSLLGRNGVGRSTACKSIMGLVDGAGHGQVQGQGYRGSAHRSGRALRHRLCAGRPPDLSDADGAAKPRTRPQALRQIRPLEFRRRVQRCFRT